MRSSQVSHSNIVSLITRRPWKPRADPRYEVEALGSLAVPGRPAIRCLVDDISLGGAKVRPVAKVQVGEGFHLLIPEFEFAAPVTVLWTTHETVGLAFPRSAVDLDTWLALTTGQRN